MSGVASSETTGADAPTATSLGHGEVSKLKAALAQAQSSKTSDQKDLQDGSLQLSRFKGASRSAFCEEAESNLEADKKDAEQIFAFSFFSHHSTTS